MTSFRIALLVLALTVGVVAPAAPATSAPGTRAPGTSALGTSALGTSAPETSALGTSAPAACVRGSAPFAVGTTTVTVRSGGQALRTTVAYPATEAGEDATRVCRRSPLVVAGHGAQGDGASAARLHTDLVARGYVVAAPTFPAGGFDFDGFAEDVTRTITKVRRASRGDGALSGLVRRRGPVGYIGTSMGAIVGLTLADRGHRDRRIGAIVAKAGRAFGRLSGAGAPPVLMINGDADTTIRYRDARASYADLRRPKGLIRLAGVGHDLNTGGDPILASASALFLDRYLRDRDRALKRIVREVKRSDIASMSKRW